MVPIHILSAAKFLEITKNMLNGVINLMEGATK